MNETRIGLKLWMPAIAALFCLTAAGAMAAEEWIVLDGYEGPGKGKHIVLVCGDEEYRSEELIPQLAKILAKHQGFKCTVLFAINKETGEIDPMVVDNIPGLEALESADLMILFTRFRELPDEQMKYIIDYTDSGKPIIGLRTSTHAFNYRKLKDSPYAKYSFRDGKFKGGYGRQVLGETWINHYGHHGRESTRGVLAPGAEGHSILRGIADGDIWGPTDVYGVRLPLPGDSKPLVLGQVLAGMTPDADPVEGKKNDPMMPVAWIKTYSVEGGPTGRVFTTTMGSSTDLASEGLRRLLVNACYWAVGLEDEIPGKSRVDLVGRYEPRAFGFRKAAKGLMPADHAGDLTADSSGKAQAE